MKHGDIPAASVSEESSACARPATAAEATQLKRLKQRRTTIKSQCTRFCTYVNQLEAESTSITELRTRLSRFSPIWEEFNQVQQEIEAIESGDVIEDTHNEERASFEEKYFTVTATLEGLIDEKAQANQPQSVIENARQVRNASFTIQGAGTASDCLKLPRISMPTYSGKYEEWTAFRNIFSSMIDQNTALPDVQKMQYLVSSLKGEAHDVISSLEPSAENYREAWEMLIDRYDDPALIIAKHVRALFDLPVMTKDNHQALRKLLDNVLKNIRALKALKRPAQHWDDLLIHLITSRIDHATCREWEATIQKGIVPSFDQLINFLSQRCRALEASARSQRTSSTSASQEKMSQSKNTTAHLATAKTACAYCQKEDHFIYRCKDFLDLSVDKRFKEVKSRNLCINCLRASPSHKAKQCSSGSCRKCDKKHNTLLHVERADKVQTESSTTPVSVNKEDTAPLSVNHAAINQRRQVLLATAVVNILDNKGQPKPVRALLDNGSQSCFITSRCCKELRLRKFPTNIPVYGLGEQSTQTRNLVQITLQSRVSSYKTDLNCLVVNKITQALPVNEISLEALQIPQDIELADMNFNRPSNIDLLLGAEIFFDLMCLGKIKLAEDQPTWQNTRLGWIVTGNLGNKKIRKDKTIVCNLAIDEQLSKSIARFWQVENCDRLNTRNPDERACEAHFMHTYRRREDGKFIVSLPTRPDVLQRLGESRSIAMQRLHGLEKRFRRNPQFRIEYADFINQYLRLEHMKEIQDPVNDEIPHFYLPHHCVIKESSTTRLRVVFDASSRTTSGISLNEALLAGPVLQQDIFSILIRFRTFKYAMIADIEKMYRQVIVNSDQTPLQRILWRNNHMDSMKTYELCTLTYGTTSASYLATKVIQRLAEIEANQFPKGAAAVLRDLYVDDFITGANSIKEAKEVRDQAIRLLQSGGFKLRKWASNCKKLLEGMPNASSSNQLLQLDKDGSSKTLGINWNPSRDVFQYRICIKMTGQEDYTKRIILAGIAQIFDPLGLLGPVIITAKIFIQELWKAQIGWDEALPIDINNRWSIYITQLQLLNGLSIQRGIIHEQADTKIELHGFCDASERAYGACVYLRSIAANHQINVQLLCSKSRVAPIKVLSIPRLELCGAQLLAKLMEKIQISLELQISKAYYWTDSSIVIHWIRATNKKLPVFVAHRIGEIQDLTAVDKWKHVGSKENPADLLSRGIKGADLAESKLWWQGPFWLHKNIDYEKCDVPKADESQFNEADESIVAAVAASGRTSPFDRFSTFSRLIRVAATCLRFAYNARKEMRRGPLSVDELEEATKRLIRREQEIAFPEEIASLQGGKAISPRSSLKYLNPFKDNDNLIRVGGRLRHANVIVDTKNPIVLPHHSRIAELIIENEHRRLMHAGAEATLAATRSRYWIIKARGSIRKLLRKCIQCFKSRPRVAEQMMGNLPMQRVNPSRPFSNVGVDYCGPIYIRMGSRRNSKRIKAYVAVFVCMATKAVHLETVSDLTTEAFLGALKRFIGRRGRPSDIFSDNGTNFVGANKELEDLRNLFKQEEHQHKVMEAASLERIKWHFIPPRAPHFGGIWESAVKSFKKHFHKVAAEAALTYEEAATLVTQIEAILNSRPLIPMSSDPNDLNYISAGHFLIGDTLMSYPEPDIANIKLNRLSRWQHLEQMRQHFWRRWSSEYLVQLQQRYKWYSKQAAQLEVGQLVLCREDGVPPMKWILGRIQEVCPGSDGIVRTAVIRTTTGTFKRPAIKLAVLPIETKQDT